MRVQKRAIPIRLNTCINTVHTFRSVFQPQRQLEHTNQRVKLQNYILFWGKQWPDYLRTFKWCTRLRANVSACARACVLCYVCGRGGGVWMSVCLSVRPSFHLCMYLYVCVCVCVWQCGCVSVCLSACLCVCLFVCVSVCLSVCVCASVCVWECAHADVRKRASVCLSIFCPSLIVCCMEYLFFNLCEKWV